VAEPSASPRYTTPLQKVHSGEGSIFAAFEQDTELQLVSLMSPANEKELLGTASRLSRALAAGCPEAWRSRALPLFRDELQSLS
jgi:hypothetical protein